MDRVAREIFVFESNVLGEHHSGAALEALKHHGAEMGCGSGIKGNSYAIPTTDSFGNPYSFSVISFYIKIFVKYTQMARYDMKFTVPAIACDRFPVAEIAPLFRRCCEDTVFPAEFYPILDSVPNRCYLDYPMRTIHGQ